DVKVINMSFARPDSSLGDAKAPGPFDFDKFDLVRIGEIAALLVTALALVFFVLGPLVRGLMARDDAGGGEAAVGPNGKRIKGRGGRALSAPDGADDGDGVTVGGRAGGSRTIQIPDGGTATINIPAAERLDAGVDVARISGQVRASSIKKISEVV